MHQEVYDWSVKLSEHLKPKTRAYHEIWLNGEKLVGPAGRRAHPRPALSTAQVQDRRGGAAAQRRGRFSQDLGFIAILDDGLEAGHCSASTSPWVAASAPRMASRRPIRASRDVIGFLTPDQVLKVAETVVMIQRDFGDRTDRKHARFKYTIADRGVDWFKAELFKRLGYALEPPRPFKFTTQGDRFGWLRGHDGRWHLTLRIESGRVVDAPGRPFLTGLEKIAAIHQGDFRLTANQNLIIANVPASECMNIDRIVADHGLGKALFTSPVRRDALACVALPTCGLAMAEAERYLPDVRRSRRRAARQAWIEGHSAHACASPAAPMAARGRISRRSRSSAALPAATRLRLGADAVGAATERASIATTSTKHAIVTALDELVRPLRAQSGRRTNASAISCGARMCSSRRRARERSVARRTTEDCSGRRRSSARRALTLTPRGVRRRCRGRQAHQRLAGVGRCRHARALGAGESAGPVRAVVELRRAGRRVAAPGHAGRSRHPGAGDRHRLSIPRDLSVHRAARAAARAQHPDASRARSPSRISRRSTASSGSRAAKGSTSISSCARSSPCAARSQTLGIATWFAGLRRSQAASRAALNPLEVRDGRFKVHPIFDWSDRDVYLYLKAHSLPYHPLWDKGYVSIGDWHSTKALHEVDSADELRFSGLKRECGIHGLEG